ncbi:SAM-dependent methyltransferase [Methyloceanibacter caenitepidi]|uniref:Nodulation protein noeA n=1 Tax=Methyloceanibacter caenitepidi TaxID=1384459 RepID=A0A0A8K140_9HYPH|nr:SAM-dependent methyltransferase [Methyloceanibacter caenitepidi]BAQ15709.1 nodulation protein noeA [Methyloceanibacter caenitepidi]
MGALKSATQLRADPGSFRDRNNRVYDDGVHIYRGVSRAALENWREVSRTDFFADLMSQSKLVRTEESAGPTVEGDIDLKSWPGVLQHDRVPFLTYPYEWSFNMLKDAALLHLDILEAALEQGWTLKDSSSFNIQWVGPKPVFIDIPSLEPYAEGTPWGGYRQFCMMFLYPLMLKAYRGIDFGPFLRSSLEGIDPSVANKILTGWTRFRKGVTTHVALHARMQERAAAKEIEEARRLTEDAQGTVQAATSMRHSKAMVLGMVQSMRRTIGSMRSPDAQTTWGEYDTGHSYGDDSFAKKQRFVEKHGGSRHRALVWDIGCNTGTFSRLCEPFADYVVSMDGDAKAIDRCYLHERQRKSSKLLPIVVDLSNVSPNQGWRCSERKALDARGNPDLVLCLALIHHMVIGANIPMAEFIDWIASLGADVIIEFVSPEDDMSQMLMRNKVNQYTDYTEAEFERLASRRFSIGAAEELKGGHRKIYYLRCR